MERIIFTGIKPTGRLTLGNYFGALRRIAAAQQQEARCIYSVVDLHAMTVPHDPARLRALTREAVTLSLAAGLDPTKCVLFRQSDVPAHTELSYLLECTAYMGELNRMIQFKEKGRGRPQTRVSLLTYPVLMAADILLYGTTEVPVGDDQRQHLELARDLAVRFNRTYGEVFVVPKMAAASVAARVMDLQDPERKMSKEDPDDAPGALRLLDPPEVVQRKVMRAVTDSATDVAYDPEQRAGVSNLLEILAACLAELQPSAASGRAGPADLAARYSSYGALKRDVADAVNAVLDPLRKRYDELAADPAYVDEVLRAGAERARESSEPVLRRVRDAMGLT